MSIYFSNSAILQSKLKDLKQSPKHFWVNHKNPDRAPSLPMSTDLEQIIKRDNEVFNLDNQIKQTNTISAIENINKQIDELL